MRISAFNVSAAIDILSWLQQMGLCTPLLKSVQPTSENGSKQPKLSALQRKRLLADYNCGDSSAGQLCEISGLSRSAMYATLRRARDKS